MTSEMDRSHWRSERLKMARFAVDEGIRAIGHQMGDLDSMDLKASFISAGSVVTLAGLLTAAAAHPAMHLLTRFFGSLAVLALAVALVASLRAWHPRDVRWPPHVRGLQRAIGGHELPELEELAGVLATAFETNLTVQLAKRVWIQRANLWLGVGGSFVALAFIREFVVGG